MQADIDVVSDDGGERASEARGWQVRYRRAILGVIVLAVCVTYLFSALTYGRNLRSTPSPQGFQAAVAEALLHGNLALGPAPPELTALDDPYDPAANGQFRAEGLHDLVLYNGKIYTATGPTPAVLANVPYRLLGLGNLNPNLATLAFCTAGFLAAVGCYLECRRRFFRDAPLWIDVAAVVSVGLGTPVPWLVSIGRSYEAAIACGFMLTALTAYLLLRALRDPAHPNLLLVSAGSCTAAAAVGARPPLALLAVFVIAAGFGMFNRVEHARRTRGLVALAAPYVAVGLLLALYNRLRFGSFTEFGTTYQLAGYNMPKYPVYRIGYLWPNITDYLFWFPRFQGRWPYVHLRFSSEIGEVHPHTNEPVAGALWLLPSIVVGLAMLGATLRRAATRARGLLPVVVLGVVVSLMLLLAVSIPFNSSTMRYEVDFAPLLVIAATVAAAGTFATSCGIRRLALGSLWVAAVGTSALVGIALVLTRCPGTGSC